MDTVAHLILFRTDGTPLAVCRYFLGEGTSFFVGRLAGRKDYHGHGLETELFHEVERQIAAQGSTEVRFAAQTHARFF